MQTDSGDSGERLERGALSGDGCSVRRESQLSCDPGRVEDLFTKEMRRNENPPAHSPKGSRDTAVTRFPVKLGQDELAGTGTEVRHSEGF